MYATPTTRSTLGRATAAGHPRALVARRSSMRGWGWHFLALHHKPHGWVEQDLGSFVHHLHRELFSKGHVHMVDRGAHSLLLLAFPDGDVVVARCDQPLGIVQPLLDYRTSPLRFERTHPDAPGTLLFVPLVLRAAQDVQWDRPSTRGSLVDMLAMDDATQARVEQDMVDAVADMERMGPVRTPWHATAGDLVAPWAMGKGRNPTLETVIHGALLDLAPDLPTSITIDVMGRTMDDQGRITGALHARTATYGTAVDGPGWDRFQAWLGGLHLRTIPHVAPIDLVAQAAEGYNPIGRDSRKGPAVLVRTSTFVQGAHRRMAALAAYRTVA